jgi:hypothetical protein
VVKSQTAAAPSLAVRSSIPNRRLPLRLVVQLSLLHHLLLHPVVQLNALLQIRIINNSHSTTYIRNRLTPRTKCRPWPISCLLLNRRKSYRQKELRVPVQR